jgi:soluble lytic murein transglycosylase-like protein
VDAIGRREHSLIGTRSAIRVGTAVPFALAVLALAAAPANDQSAARPGPVSQAVPGPKTAPVPVSQPDPVARWRPFIAEASRRFGVPAAWIERVMRAESGGRTTRNGRPISSPAGAMGLMQLMPATWAELSVR